MSNGVVAADHLITDVAGVLSPGWMAVEQGCIAGVHGGTPPSDATLLCESGGVIMPAFVNAHAHLSLGLLGGIGDDFGFAEWMKVAMLPAVQRGIQDREVFLEGAVQSIGQLMAGGVGTVADSFLDALSMPLMSGCGLRGFFGHEVFGSRAEDLEEYVAGVLREPLMPDLFTGLIRPGYAPHSLYTCPPEVMAAVVRQARAKGLRCTVHVDESPEEHECFTHGTGSLADHLRSSAMASRYRFDASPVRQLADLGLLGPDLLVVHAVQVDSDDIALLAATRTPVVHCPRSNMMLSVGVAPVAEMLAKGVTVALGTDSPASTPDLDMFEEMRCAILAQRAVRQRTLTALDAFMMATLAGARALGLGDVTGSLQCGKGADFVRLELPCIRNQRRDPLARVVWEGRPECVTHTFVQGRDVLAELQS